MRYPLFFSLALLVASAPFVRGAELDTSTRTEADPALTASQRLKVFLKNDFGSPGAFFRAAGPAVGMEMGNNPPEWGKTAEGYGRRVASLALGQTTGDAVQAAVSAMTGRDPRYQKCGCTGAWHRAGHAIAGVFVAADAHGALGFDPSNLLGAYAGGFAGASLYPARYSVPTKGLQLGNQLVGQSAVQNMALEFSPELKHFFLHTLLFRK